MVFSPARSSGTMKVSSLPPVAARGGSPTLPGLAVVNTRVVVVDDVADIRWLLRAALDADGRFDVVGEAGDGREGVDVVKLTRPSVAVIDLRMPRMDGLEAAAEIAKVSPETRVVIFSAVSEAAVAAAAREMTVVGFVRKGAPPKAIVDAVALAAAS
jgi:DNA-binding NarL/FixJ family response regulator